MKSEKIEIRVTSQEKLKIIEDSITEGFNSYSAFILWLYRKFKKGKS